jgi:hypothetical protein
MLSDSTGFSSGYLFCKAHFLVQKIKIKLLRQQKLIFEKKNNF